MIRIVLIEDDPHVRTGIREVLARCPNRYEWVGEASTVVDARVLCADTRPDVILLDLGLPDGGGADLLRELRARKIDALALVLTIFDDDSHVFDALSAGAVGYLLKDDIPARLSSSLDDLVAGGAPMSPSIARRILATFATPPSTTMLLTPREREVIEHLARGLTYDEIGTSLGISTNTVRTFIRSIYEKLHVCSKTEAVFEAMRLGLVKRP